MVVGDITCLSDLRAAVARACDLGPLRGWVNNAGNDPLVILHEPIAEEVDKSPDVNVRGDILGQCCPRFRHSSASADRAVS